jgi:hypothetical protein
MSSDENEDARDESAAEAAHPHDEEVEGAGEELDDADGADPLLSGGLRDLLSQLEEATEEVDEIAEEASSTIVEGRAAGGSVVIGLTGALEAVAVHIDPTLVDPDDVAMLEDAVLAALRDGLGQVRELQRDLAGALDETEIDLSALLGNLGNLANLGGLGLPDLGSLTNPEDLIAGLGGALGSITGSQGGFGGLSDLLGGLGLPHSFKDEVGAESGESASAAGVEPADAAAAEAEHEDSDADEAAPEES